MGFGDGAGQRIVDGDHAAQCLEGAEAEALALVLDPQLADAKPLCERRQRIQGRRAMFATQQGADVGHFRGIDHGTLGRTKGLGGQCPGVCGEPGRYHIAS